jgi:hypothetical protein
MVIADPRRDHPAAPTRGTHERTTIMRYRKLGNPDLKKLFAL